MRASTSRILTSIVLLAGLLAVGASAANDERERLDAVRERIEAVNRELAADREREDTASAELRRVESRMGETRAALKALRGDIHAAEERVAAARERVAAERDRVEGHRDTLARQVRAAHRSGREEYLRLLLDQQDPDRIDRMLVYYEYLTAARAERLTTAVDALQTLRRREEVLDERLAELRGLEREQETRVAQLRADQAERTAVLARLRERVASRDDELTSLRADEQRLEELLAELRRQLADIPDAVTSGEPFGALRGELGWPLVGPIVSSFGGERSGGIRWSGVLIGAEAGDEVQAVSHGRVVFSDWLRGVGLLIIIDHGDGYLTLYGRNQALYRDAGEWVSAGEVIATVGASGGQRRDALYFEVRKGGSPVDPLAWLGPAPQPG